MMKDNKQYRILIVEDNMGDFTIVEDCLIEEILNPVIVHAVNFKQASQILVDTEIPFDIILLDLTLPDKQGRELILETLKIAKLSPIIILTGYADTSFSISSIAEGIFDYLVKDDLNKTLLYKSMMFSIERKKSLSALKKSEERYSNLFNLSPQPMWVYNPCTFKFTEVNNAALELYGYTEAEFLNMKMTDLKIGEDIPLVQKRLLIESPANVVDISTSKHYTKSKKIIELEIYATTIMINDVMLRSVIAIDVTERNIQEQKIMKAIIKTQEDERYEIGGELHDNVCQILAGTLLHLGMLKRYLPAEKMSNFDQCDGNIHAALEEIRKLSHRLAPAFFDDSTMQDSFKTLFKNFIIGSEIEIVLHFDKTVTKYPLTADLQLNLYRILQEQLKNILKYAKASLVEVEVLIDNNKLKMKVSDNGIGFNINARRTGIGLANMKRRAEIFSGNFEIESSPGNGCSIRIDIPLSPIPKLSSTADNAVLYPDFSI